MANYFYLSSASGGGTTGNSYGTKQTGTFTALTSTNVFSTLAQVITAGPVAGDFICVSSSHQETTTAATLTIGSAGGASYGVMVSVDEANCDTYKVSTAYQFSLGGTYTVNQMHHYGIAFTTANFGAIRPSLLNSMVTFNQGSMTLTGTADSVVQMGTLQCVKFRGVEFISDTGTSNYIVNGASAYTRVEFENCKISVANSGTWAAVTRYFNGQSFVSAKGCDFSLGGTVIMNSGGVTNDDEQICILNNCQLQSSTSAGWNETQAVSYSRIEAYNCTDSTSDHPNQFWIGDYVGTVESVFEDNVPTGSGVVRTDGTAMDMESAGLYLSAKVITTSKCGRHYPLSFELPAQWSGLSSVSTDVIRLYIASSVTLTDADIVITASYRDGTNTYQIRTVENAVFDPIGAGTALTTDSTSTWTNSGALNKYQVDLDTSGAAGIDQIPIITIHVMKAGTIHFDTEYDLVA